MQNKRSQQKMPATTLGIRSRLLVGLITAFCLVLTTLIGIDAHAQERRAVASEINNAPDAGTITKVPKTGELTVHGLTESQLREALSRIEQEHARLAQLQKWVNVGGQWYQIPDHKRTVRLETPFDRIHPFVFAALIFFGVLTTIIWSADEVDLADVFPVGPNN